MCSIVDQTGDVVFRHFGKLLLEDAFEALLGAIYLDGGIAAAEEFLQPHMRELANSALPSKDAKTALQEWAQARGLPVPEYKIIETVGAAHAPVFTVEALVKGHTPVQSKAASKKIA